MSIKIKAVEALDLWRGAIVESVRRDAPDLSARQMALLLTVYMTPPPHTVRGLAEALKVSKPAITRAVDRLSEYGLVRRKVDDKDRRSVLIQRTVKGSVFLREFGDVIVHAAAEVAAPLADASGTGTATNAGAGAGASANGADASVDGRDH